MRNVMITFLLLSSSLICCEGLERITIPENQDENQNEEQSDNDNDEENQNENENQSGNEDPSGNQNENESDGGTMGSNDDIQITPFPNDEEPTPTGTGESSASFVAFGDWGTGGDEQREVASAIGDYCETENCEFILTLGDNFYSDGVESVTDEQWEEKYHDVYDFLDLPFYASLGNHDNNGNIQAQIDYSEIDPDWNMPEENYSYTWPENADPVVEFFVFNSDYPRFREESAQNWMREAIAESQADWKILVMHHPIYSDGNHGDDDQGNNEFLFPIICNEVDLVVSGHDHNFAHLRGPDADCPIEQLVIGTGGAGIRDSVTETEAQVIGRGNFHGFGWFQITSDEIFFRMVESDGDYFYTYGWSH